MAEPAVIPFAAIRDATGALCVYETGKGVPFEIARVFTVTARAGQMRGRHAHRRCAQLLASVAGTIKVKCDSGDAISEYVLEEMGDGLLVPPGNWCTQEYVREGSVLIVLCDRGYEADDYIRDYDEFRKFRSVSQ